MVKAKTTDEMLDAAIQGLDSPPARTRQGDAVAKQPDPRLFNRRHKLAELVSGDVVERTVRMVDPSTCRMWAHHNRRYAELNDTNCADLLEGIKAEGGQQFAAIVRELSDDPEHRYEVICGARRHWAISYLRAHNYPSFKFVVEVRELTDEEAFRLSDVENRDRTDISDYERAIDYLGALKRYYEGKQKAMAERLNVSESWLSKYLDLARLPKAIVEAYATHEDFRVKHGVTLKPFLRTKEQQARVMAGAEDLKKEQAVLRAAGHQPIAGPVVVARLKAAAAQPRKSRARVIGEYGTAKGQTFLTVKRAGGGKVMMELLPRIGASREEFLSACAKAFDAVVGD